MRHNDETLINLHNTEFNSYTFLKSWLTEDLLFRVNTKLPLIEIKNRLASLNLLERNEFPDKLKQLVLKVLNSENCAFVEYLNELFLDAYFSEDAYVEMTKHLINSNSKFALKKRLLTLNRPHTHAYIAVLSQDKNLLCQVDRASMLATAALRLYERFTSGNYSTYLNTINLNTFSYQYFFSYTTFPCFNGSTDKININLKSRHIVVLICGQAYKFDVFINNKLLSANEVREAINRIIYLHKNDNTTYPPIGAISSASRKMRSAIRKKYYHSNKRSFDAIESAIFILCLDTIPYKKNIAENMFSYHFSNRYFGNTQFIIGTRGEAAVIANYVKIDGTPAIEIIDNIYHDSLMIELLEKTESRKIRVDKLDFKLEKTDINKLSLDVSQVLHNEKSTRLLGFGIQFFKKINLSPNIAMNNLILLSIYKLTGCLPVANHATSRRERSTAQLDWNYIPLMQLAKFIEYYENEPSLNFTIEFTSLKPTSELLLSKKDKILLFGTTRSLDYIFVHPNIINTYLHGKLHKNELTKTLGFYPESSIQLTSAQEADLIYYILKREHIKLNSVSPLNILRNTIEHNKKNILLTKQGLSPTFFVKKPYGEAYDNLSDFYSYLGQYIPAYRNYLFRTYRNNNLIDIMTSSLKLPPSIQTIGRHGSCSEVLTMFGLHILMKDHDTELVFIPNKSWVKELDNIVSNIRLWSMRMRLLTNFGE